MNSFFYNNYNELRLFLLNLRENAVQIFEQNSELNKVRKPSFNCICVFSSERVKIIIFQNLFINLKFLAFSTTMKPTIKKQKITYRNQKFCKQVLKSIIQEYLLPVSIRKPKSIDKFHRYLTEVYNFNVISSDYFSNGGYLTFQVFLSRPSPQPSNFQHKINSISTKF